MNSSNVYTTSQKRHYHTSHPPPCQHYIWNSHPATAIRLQRCEIVHTSLMQKYTCQEARHIIISVMCTMYKATDDQPQSIYTVHPFRHRPTWTKTRRCILHFFLTSNHKAPIWNKPVYRPTFRKKPISGHTGKKSDCRQLNSNCKVTYMIQTVSIASKLPRNQWTALNPLITGVGCFGAAMKMWELKHTGPDVNAAPPNKQYATSSKIAQFTPTPPLHRLT